MKKQFIGKREVKKIEGDKVYFVDDETERPMVYSEESLKNIITDEPLDLTSLRDKKVFPVVKEILEVLLKHNLYLSELEYTMQRVIMSISHNRQVAEDLVWGSPEHEKNLYQVDQIIKTLSPKP